MLRRTKIVATLGPATDDPAVLKELILAGVNVVRVNFSHGSHEDHLKRIRVVREASDEVRRVVGILGDLQGPKIRIQKFKKGSIELREGQRFTLDAGLDEFGGNDHSVGIDYKQLPEDVAPGDRLLLDDGQIVMQVLEVEGVRVVCEVVVGGALADNKGINRQGGGLSADALTEKDRDDIKFAAREQVDYLAVSFPRDAQDIEHARRLLRQARGKGRIVAKIERAEAIANLEEIIGAADVVMVARGDLGVEVGYAALIGLQKRIIRETRHRNRIAITATQMMESMINSQHPTRAEVSDVANAAMDGTDAIMLSAETAIGQYPVKVVQAASEVCLGAEAHQLASTRSRHRIDTHFRRIDEAIAMSVMYTAAHLDVKAIIAMTESGSTALWMSRIRSDIPIYAFTPHRETQRRVTLYRGVYPIPFDMEGLEPDQVNQAAFDKLLRLGRVAVGDIVIFTKGDRTGVSGGTNSMRILRVTSS